MAPDIAPVHRTPKLSARESETLVDHVHAVFLGQPDACTYRFYPDGEGELLTLTNAEFDLRVRAIAVALMQQAKPGDRALIVCPPGLDYIASFFACLYAGLIAVPVYPPNPALLARTLPRLLGIISDAQPQVVLAPASIVSISDEIAAQAPAMRTLGWLAVDEIDTSAGSDWRRPDIRRDDVAFLQYTSGSTGQPKGVMVSHGNLLHNLDTIYQTMLGDHPDTHVVTWLPPYHDMGLIGGLLEPAYGGFPATMMSPLAFLKRPVRWLRAISEVKATISGGPNFAYDLCLTKVSEEERQLLDLSHWRTAFNGAEPIRAETLDRFSRVFAPNGFRREAFYPCYGLAEATLMVSGGEVKEEPVVRALDGQALMNNTAVDARPGQEDRRMSVGCGRVVAEQELAIVDPETLTRVPDGQIGEIWVRGESVALGYWQRPVESEQIFAARLSDSPDKVYLRTGDLGFVDGGELFVTGRIKDVIIVAGKNHYPHDIELTVEQSHELLRPGCGVVCTVDVGDEQEALLVVHEVDRNPTEAETDEIVSAVRAAVAQEHGLQVRGIVMIRRGTIPKTSSGKLQRSACRKAFLEDSFKVVARWGLQSPHRK